MTSYKRDDIANIKSLHNVNIPILHEVLNKHLKALVMTKIAKVSEFKLAEYMS
jgi:hypothetical protein